MSVVFFTDRDLGLRFPAILAGAGLAVERHADRRPTAAPSDGELRVSIHALSQSATKGRDMLVYDPDVSIHALAQSATAAARSLHEP